MKTLLPLLLAVSIVANVCLLAWPAVWSVPAPASAPAPSAAPGPGIAGAQANSPAGVPAALFAGGDPAALRDTLRAAGAEETVIRAVLEGVLRRRQREQLAALRMERARSGWWRGAAGVSDGDEARRLRQTVLEPLRALLGRDPRDLRDAENRYPFLAADKRRRLAEIDLDYLELEAAGAGSSLERLKSEREQEALLARELLRDVLAALTPEERAEYDLRFAGTAVTVSRRLATYGGSEAEYRVLKPLLDDLERATRDLPRGEAFGATYAALQQQAMDRMVAALGYERALNYIWGGPGLFPSIGRALQGMNLPVSRAAELLELAAETAERAAAIHRDPALEVARKRAELQALQESVRPQFAALVPAGLQSRLPEPAVAWFTLLGEGSYKGFHPTLLSSGLGEIAPVSVASRPPAAPAWPQPLPRRPRRG